MEKRYFDELDSLRGIFIMGIVIYHIRDAFNGVFSEILDPIYKYGGYFGNYFFFMLSGFLIAFSYKQIVREGRISFSGFLARRLIKIYPLYILSTIVQLCLMILLSGTYGITAKTLLLNAFMMACGWIEDTYPLNLPLWFVCVLMLCYILYFAVCRLTKTGNKKYIFMLLAFMLWGYILEIKNWDFPFCYACDGEGLLNFFTGCLLFEIYSGLDTIQKKRLSAVGLTALFALAILSYYKGFSAVSGDIRIVITAIICTTVIFCALTVSPVKKLLSFRPLQSLGKISMSVFCWHSPFLKISGILGIYSLPCQAGFISYLLLLILFCGLSHLTVEKKAGSLFGILLSSDKNRK